MLKFLKKMFFGERKTVHDTMSLSYQPLIYPITYPTFLEDLSRTCERHDMTLVYLSGDINEKVEIHLERKQDEDGE